VGGGERAPTFGPGQMHRRQAYADSRTRPGRPGRWIYSKQHDAGIVAGPMREAIDAADVIGRCHGRGMLADQRPLSSRRLRSSGTRGSTR